MPEHHHDHLSRRLITVLATLALAGCAADREHTQGLDLVKQGLPIKGLESLKRAAEMDPQNPRFQIDYVNKHQETVRALLLQADNLASNQAWEAAAKLYRDVLGIEPANVQAQRGIKQMDAERRAVAQLATAERLLQAGKADQAAELAGQVLRELPRHLAADQLRRAAEEKMEGDRQAREEQLAAKAAFRRPISLTFRDTPLKMIFEALSRGASINVVLDRDVKSDVKSTIFVKDAAIEDAIDMLLLQNQLDKRVLNSNTILVFPATAAKQKEFAELKVRSFQLSNIDAALMGNILKTMLKTKDIVTDPKTNILVMRDTVEAISLAERLVAANDVPDAEVMLEVKVLEVGSNRTNELGLKLPTAATFSTPTVGTNADGTASSAWTISDLHALTRGQIRVSPITATLNMLMTDGDTQLLANPSIRARNKEKARILVGDKLPQITNVLSATGTTAGNTSGYSALTGNIQYIDVGIKLEVEPEIYTDGDVGIKLMLEVSNVTGNVATQSGTAYQIGTRSAQTNLRLHDGETQILGGLIRNSNSDSAQRLPGLGQLPAVGRLFSSNKAEGQKTEIIVAITPHIIRARTIPELRYSDAWSGSDTMVRDRPLRLDPIGALKLAPPKADAGAASTGNPAVRTPVVTPPRPAAPASVAPAPEASSSDAAGQPEPQAAGAAKPANATVPSGPPRYAPPVVPRTVPQGIPRRTEPEPTPAPAPAEPADTPAAPEPKN